MIAAAPCSDWPAALVGIASILGCTVGVAIIGGDFWKWWKS